MSMTMEAMHDALAEADLHAAGLAGVEAVSFVTCMEDSQVPLVRMAERDLAVYAKPYVKNYSPAMLFGGLHKQIMQNAPLGGHVSQTATGVYVWRNDTAPASFTPYNKLYLLHREGQIVENQLHMIAQMTSVLTTASGILLDILPVRFP